MRKTQSKIDGQATSYLPIVLYEDFKNVSADIIQTVKFLLSVVSNVASQQICISAASGITTPVSKCRNAVGVPIGWLIVNYVFIEATQLGGMSAPYFADLVREGGQKFVGEKAAGTTNFKTARIDNGCKFTTPSGDGRNLLYSVLKQTGETGTNSGAIHFSRIVKHIREFDGRETKNKFVGHGGAKHLG